MKMCKLFPLVLLIFSLAVFNISKANDEEKQDEQSLIDKKLDTIFNKLKPGTIFDLTLLNEIVDIGEDAVPYLEKALYKKNYGKYMLAADSLAKICGAKCIPKLLKAYFADDFDRIGIRHTILSFKEEALPYLYKEFTNEDELKRYYVVYLISDISVSKALEALQKQYKKEKSNLVKLYIIGQIYKLDKQNQKEYLEYVHKMLKSESVDEKVEAIYVVGDINDESQIDLLIECIEDDNERIYKSAIQNLVKIDNEKAIDAVLKTLKHKDIERKCCAAISLRRDNIKNKEFHKKIVNTLLEVIDDKSSRFRSYVLFALSDHDDPKIIKKLEEMAEKDPAASIRKLAKQLINSKNGRRINEGIEDEEDDDKNDGKIKPKSDDED